MRLEVKKLYCERDERILFSELSFTINSGEVVQIEGQNGSGKTTLLRILCGLNEAFEGDILWNNYPIKTIQTDYYAEMLYVGHLAGVKSTLTAEENLTWMQRLDPNLNKMTIEQALHKVGLYGFEDVPCYTLSAGQQRRVGLARLYLSSAPLWILDEPFTALDKHGVAEKEALLSEHVLQGGAVILTTHHNLEVPNHAVRHINLDEVVRR